MDGSRRNQLVLGALVVALAGVLYRNWPREPGSSGTSARASAQRVATPSSVAQGDAVRLDALKAVGGDVRPIERNLFRFQGAAVQAPRAGEPGGGVPRPAAPVVAAGPVGPAPITLKFIGVVEEGVAAQRIAFLSDTRGVYEGREGDVIEGRYRIVRIGAESIEMAYVDGRGRQTIRLSGS